MIEFHAIDRSYDVTDLESSNPSSNLGRTFSYDGKVGLNFVNAIGPKV